MLPQVALFFLFLLIMILWWFLLSTSFDSLFVNLHQYVSAVGYFFDSLFHGILKMIRTCPMTGGCRSAAL